MLSASCLTSGADVMECNRALYVCVLGVKPNSPKKEKNEKEKNMMEEEEKRGKEEGGRYRQSNMIKEEDEDEDGDGDGDESKI